MYSESAHGFVERIINVRYYNYDNYYYLGFSTSMEPFVYLQAATRCKRLLANISYKELMTCVDPVVRHQVTMPGKSLVAYVTNKGFMADVYHPVCLQVTSLCKCLTTSITAKGFITSVNPLVCLRISKPCKCLIAHITHMPLGSAYLMRTQSLKVLSLQPGVGEYITMHATLTARDFFLVNFYPSGPFTCIVSKTSPKFFCVSCS